MIHQEQTTIDNKEFIHTWTDKNVMLRQLETGCLYSDVFDLVEFQMHYEETDIPQDAEEEDAEEVI